MYIRKEGGKGGKGGKEVKTEAGRGRRRQRRKHRYIDRGMSIERGGDRQRQTEADII